MISLIDANSTLELDRHGAFPQNTNRTGIGMIVLIPDPSAFSVANSLVVQYYKPWQLRSGDEAVIREQIEEAEATVAREVAEFDARYPPEAFKYEKLEPISTETTGPPGASEEQQLALPAAEPVSEQAPIPEPKADTAEPKETPVEKDAQPSEERPSEPTTTDAAPTSAVEAADSKDTHRAAHDDDGDEMLEDNEDNVIY